jgi:hypothetical protein
VIVGWALAAAAQERCRPLGEVLATVPATLVPAVPQTRRERRHPRPDPSICVDVALSPVHDAWVAVMTARALGWCTEGPCPPGAPRLTLSQPLPPVDWTEVTVCVDGLALSSREGGLSSLDHVRVGPAAASGPCAGLAIEGKHVSGTLVFAR